LRKSLYYSKGRSCVAKDAFALLSEDQVTAKWEVQPNLIGDVLALTGDSVDNIPGVGLGRKTAAALIREFSGLDSLLANIDKVKKRSNPRQAR